MLNHRQKSTDSISSSLFRDHIERDIMFFFALRYPGAIQARVQWRI